MEEVAAVVGRLAVMLAAGLVVRWGLLGVGRTLASKSTLRIPALVSYGIAGTLAAAARLALEAWTPMGRLAIWIAFGAVWGCVAGLLLPFARRMRGPLRGGSA
jgi:hypothetical protein